MQGWYSALIVIVGCQKSKILLNWQVNSPEPTPSVLSPLQLLMQYLPALSNMADTVHMPIKILTN